jgi:phosphoglycerate dehydrogenase-like enzyme
MSILYIGLPEDQLTASVKARITSLAPNYRVLFSTSYEQVKPFLDDIEIAAVDFPVEWIRRATNLRWYQQWGAGTDWLIQHPDIARKNFLLTNASGVHSIPISEHILALMLAFSRRLPAAIRAQIERKWLPAEDAGELAGKKVLLIGVGAIGKQTARLAFALGMQVTGVRRRPGELIPGIETMVGAEQLLEVLPDADFVILTIPLTAETKHIIDRDAIDAMKPGAYVINIGRGGTVNETALIEALKSGKIAGAGLDVFEEEPLPAHSPLWAMENVIITAHYSGNTPHYDERAFEIFLENLENYIASKPMRNVVDKDLGY